MGIYQKTPKQEVEKYLDQELSKIEKVVINTLNRVGLLCITEARDNGSYLDQTGNLRSSIGYAIVKNGVIYSQSDFQRVKQGTSGRREGTEFLRELLGEYGTGIALIVVAGMNYAGYVETSRNVLQSSELLAKKLVPQILGKLGFKRK